MGIVGWIIDKLVEMTFSVIGSVLIWFAGLFADLFGFSFDTFKAVFPGYHNMLSIIIAFGIAICFLIYIWQLIRCMVGAISGDVDDPFLMSFKLIFVVFAIYFWWDIMKFVRVIFVSPFNLISKWSLSTYNSISSKTQTKSVSTTGALIPWLQRLTKTKITFGSAAKTLFKYSLVGSTSGMIIKLILIIAIGWNYVKYLIEYVERYVLFMILTLLAPLAIGTAVSKQTNDISKKFARMYASSMFMIVMAHLGLLMINLAFANCSKATAGKDGLNFIVWCLVVYATLIVMQKIDKHFAAVGMNTAQTGGAMLDLAATAMSTFRSLQKNGQGFLTGLTGVKGGLAGLAGAHVANNQAKGRMSNMISAFKDGKIGEDELKKGAKTLGRNKSINGVTMAALENAANKEIANKQHGTNQKTLDAISRYLNEGKLGNNPQFDDATKRLNGTNNEEALTGTALQNDLNNKNHAYAQLNDILENKNSTPADKQRAMQLKASIENDISNKVSNSSAEDIKIMESSAPDIFSDSQTVKNSRVLREAAIEKEAVVQRENAKAPHIQTASESWTPSKESQSHSVPITKNTTSSKKSNVSSSFNEEK